jgi:hypothetical protein
MDMFMQNGFFLFIKGHIEKGLREENDISQGMRKVIFYVYKLYKDPRYTFVWDEMRFERGYEFVEDRCLMR